MNTESITKHDRHRGKGVWSVFSKYEMNQFSIHLEEAIRRSERNHIAKQQVIFIKRIFLYLKIHKGLQN